MEKSKSVVFFSHEGEFLFHDIGMNDVANEMIAAARVLKDAVNLLSFGDPVAYVYNPLDYAWDPHEMYLRMYAATKKKTLFLGMNPGPFGMAQTGVPFGEIESVTNWLHVSGKVSAPEKMHPKRPVEGFSCPRSEVSGRRLWGLFQDVYGSADEFFRTAFVANYCPLIWMSASGSNITPDKLDAKARAQVDAACLDHLVRVIRILEPEYLVGVGAYAAKKLAEASEMIPEGRFKMGTILHPSPASPVANKNWPARPREQLLEMGLIPGV